MASMDVMSAKLSGGGVVARHFSKGAVAPEAGAQRMMIFSLRHENGLSYNAALCPFHLPAQAMLPSSSTMLCMCLVGLPLRKRIAGNWFSSLSLLHAVVLLGFIRN
jgi:hypothetical protein